MLARGVGLVGTVILTRFLDPHATGEVQIAVVLAVTANQVSNFGMGNYVASKPNEGPAAVFHVTVFNTALACVACLICLASRYPLSRAFGSAAAAQYVPYLLLSALIDRITIVPARILVRDMRFRQQSLIATASELAFPAVLITSAVSGAGAYAIVYANLTRAIIRGIAFVLSVAPAEWLAPCRLRWDKTKDIFRFGIPNGIAVMAGVASKNWDNLVVSSLFGPNQLGLYQLAYNLADVPAANVGEQIGDVLLPSFARLPPERRGEGLARSLRLLGLIMLPLAVGLAAVAPVAVQTFLPPKWADVAPRLAILAFLSAVTPIGYVLHAYFNATGHPRWVMVLGITRILLVLGCVAALGLAFGPIAACAGPILAFLIHALISLMVAGRLDARTPLTRVLRGLAMPALACVPLWLTVRGVRIGLDAVGVHIPAVQLVASVLLGAAAYAASALVIARDNARDFLELARGTLSRRRGRA